MNVREMIRDLERMAETVGDDAEFVLYDRTNDREIRVDVDSDDFGFEVMRGDNEVVVEFE